MKSWKTALSALLAAFAVCAVGGLFVGRTAYRAATAMEEQAAKDAQKMLAEIGNGWQPEVRDRYATAEAKTRWGSQAGKTEWSALAESGKTVPSTAKVESLRFVTEAGRGPHSKAVVTVQTDRGAYTVTMVQDGQKWLLDRIDR